MIGAYDLHLHIGPEAIPRKYDAIQAGEALAQDGLAGAVLKSHYYSTAPFVQMARERGRGNVWGSLALNHYVGGLNPFALRGSLGLKETGGAPLLKVVWMPTIHAKAHLQVRKELGEKYDVPPEWTGGMLVGTPVEQVPPLCVTDPGVQENLKEILRIIAANDLILATGHLSKEEVFYLVPLARSLGVEKIILTHPAYVTTRLTVPEIRQLTALGGVYAEQSYALMPIDHLTPGDVADYIRGVGPEHTIMSTDLGQRAGMSPGEGMGLFVSLMEREGITPQEIRTMAVENPAKLLGI